MKFEKSANRTAPLFVLQGRGLVKSYPMGRTQVNAVRGVDVQIRQNQFVVIAGTSGSGKSTLLNLLGCVDDPDEGSVFVEGCDTRTLTSEGRAHLRAKSIGYIFQTFNLLPVLTAEENVEYPLMLLGIGKRERRERAIVALEKVGLRDHLRHLPSDLSGGQRQRVAIARAIVKSPAIVLADEPSANLDQRTTVQILDLMEQLREQEKVTFAVASHDPLVIERACQTIWMEDGRICSEKQDPSVLVRRAG